jgi:hypothetical protein
MTAMLCILSLTSVFAVNTRNNASQKSIQTETGEAVSFISEKTVLSREEGMDIKGVLPCIPTRYGEFGTELNAQIDKVYKQKISNAKESKARTINFSYEVSDCWGLTSLLIYTTTSTTFSKAEVNSFNFVLDESRFITVEDLLGTTGFKLSDKIITAIVRADTERYFANFPGLSTEQAFSFTDDEEIIFMFDAFQIAPGSEGIIKFPIRMANIKSVTIQSGVGYWVKNETYGLKMVSLRDVCEPLGYSIGWNSANKTVVVTRPEGQVVQLSPTTNVYVTGKAETPDKVSKRALESSPQIVDGKTYVPISFFDQILDSVVYQVNKDDSVTFSVYYNTSEEESQEENNAG